MTKIEKIRELTKRVLNNHSLYDKDYRLSKTLIFSRDFEGLQLLIQSIITKEERKAKPDRIINFDMLIEAKTLIDEYKEQKIKYENGNDDIKSKSNFLFFLSSIMENMKKIK